MTQEPYIRKDTIPSTFSKFRWDFIYNPNDGLGYDKNSPLIYDPADSEIPTFNDVQTSYHEAYSRQNADMFSADINYLAMQLENTYKIFDLDRALDAIYDFGVGYAGYGGIIQKENAEVYPALVREIEDWGKLFQKYHGNTYDIDFKEAVVNAFESGLKSSEPGHESSFARLGKFHQLAGQPYHEICAMDINPMFKAHYIYCMMVVADLEVQGKATIDNLNEAMAGFGQRMGAYIESIQESEGSLICDTLNNIREAMSYRGSEIADSIVDAFHNGITMEADDAALRSDSWRENAVLLEQLKLATV